MNKWITAFLLIVAFLYYSNNFIEVSEHTLHSSKWPAELDGYRIIHLSDLHNKSFGKNQSRLIKKIQDLNPDLIVMTGDVIDRRHYKKQPATRLMEACVDIATTAYVTGNHEVWHGSASALRAELETLGVIVLNNETVNISNDLGTFTLSGIADRADFMGQYDYELMLNRLSDASKDLTSKDLTYKDLTSKDQYHILLSHRPEQFEAYAEAKYDLALSGHSHGGQFRFPFIGGLIAPDQGLFPKYDGGLYEMGDSQMVVSRGLGNSLMPFRLYNQPEIPVISLYSKKTGH